MIYKGDKRGTLYRGDYKPVAMYRGENKIDGWTEETKTAPAEFVNTYNDAFGVTALGRGKQDGTPTPETPVDLVASGGAVRSCGKNLFVPTIVNCANCTNVVIAADNLSASALGNASPTKPGELVHTSGWIQFYCMPFPADTYTWSFDIEVLDGSNAEFVSPRSVLATTTTTTYTLHYINANTTQHVVFSKSVPKSYGLVNGISITCNSQHIRVSNIMIQAGAVADAPYEKGFVGSTVDMPVLRQIPGTDIRDKAEYIGGGQWKITRKVGVVQSYTAESVGSVWCSSTGALSSGATVWYESPAPTTETVTLGELATFPRYTDIVVPTSYPPEISAIAKVRDDGQST